MTPAKARKIVAELRSVSIEEAAEILLTIVNGKEIELVFPFHSEKFRAAWDELVKQPKWKKKTASALQKSLNDLSIYSEEIAIKAIEKAHAGGYQGIFPENIRIETPKFETEAQRRERQNNNVIAALQNGEIQWKK